MKEKRFCLSFFLVLLLLGAMILSSCNNRGKNRVVHSDEHIQIELGDGYNTVVVNKDSLETTNKQKHDSLTLSEHRVYYVDYSWSMTTGDNANVDGTGMNLLELVKSKLKSSIREIDSQNVTVEIIPFLDSSLWTNGEPSDVFVISKNGVAFNADELNRMDAFIDKIHKVKKDNGTHYNTHHSIVINDFLHNRIGDDTQYHMMILLTDGVDESSKDKIISGVEILDKEWETKTKSKYVFGIFVNLMENTEISGDLPNRFKNNESYRRYYKKGLNFDFNVFILEPRCTIEHRKNNYACITIGGTIPEFYPEIQEDEHYRYTLIQPDETSSYVMIRVDTLTSSDRRPNLHKHKLYYHYRLKGTDVRNDSEFIPSGHEIELTVVDEKTPNIKFMIANHTKDSLPTIKQSIDYCKKLFGFLKPEWSDTITIKIPYEKSDDAKYKDEYNKLKLNISNLPDYVTLIGNREIILDKPSDTISFSLTLDPSKSELVDNTTIEGYFDVTEADGLKAIFVNNLPLSHISSSNQIGLFRIKAVKQLHPIIICLLVLIASLILLWLALMAFILAYRAAKPKFSNKIPVLQFGTLPEAAGYNLTPEDFIRFSDYGYLNKYIHYVRFDTRARCHKHFTWGLHNWWNFKLAFGGDVHIHPLNSNLFANTIDLVPNYKGIDIKVDCIDKEEIVNLGHQYMLAEKSNEGVIYKLIVYGCQNPIVND